MNEQDKKPFYECMTLAGLVYSKDMPKPLVKFFYEALKQFEFQEVKSAIEKHCNTSKFFPTIADIIEKIPKSAEITHPGADEAWSICLESFDEQRTVVMTAQIAEARTIALEIMESGDKTAARMAFRDSYNRITAGAGNPEWFISEGIDKSLRHAAVEKAAQLGRIGTKKVEHFWEHHPEVVITKTTERVKSLQHIADIKTLIGISRD